MQKRFIKGIMQAILYTVWSTFGVDESHEDLNRGEAVSRYGEVTIDALERVLTINPERIVGLHGAVDELRVGFAPTEDTPVPFLDGAGPTRDGTGVI